MSAANQQTEAAKTRCVLLVVSCCLVAIERDRSSEHKQNISSSYSSSMASLCVAPGSQGQQQQKVIDPNSGPQPTQPICWLNPRQLVVSHEHEVVIAPMESRCLCLHTAAAYNCSAHCCCRAPRSNQIESGRAESNSLISGRKSIRVAPLKVSQAKGSPLINYSALLSVGSSNCPSKE